MKKKSVYNYGMDLFFNYVKEGPGGLQDHQIADWLDAVHSMSAAFKVVSDFNTIQDFYNKIRENF